MKTSTKRILSIGLAALFFVAILVVYGSFIRPELTRIEEKRSVVISKEELFQNESNAVGQVQDLIGQFQSISALQETVSLALPQDENVTGILNQVQSIANLSGASLRSFAVRPLAFEPTNQTLVRRLGSLEIVVSATGPYENLKRFLKSLETNVRVSNVSSFRFFPASSPGVNNYNLNITVETFYQE